MGAYMAKPSTDKVSQSGSSRWLTYNVSSMQGWRMHQEDAHNCIPDFDPDRLASLFAVYDGHGGSEVARYCASHLPQFLRSLPSYSTSDPDVFLKQLFLDFDISLITPEVQVTLRALNSKAAPDKNDDDHADDHADTVDAVASEINALRAEANEPLESVLERYGGEAAMPETIKLLMEYRKQSKVGESSKSTPKMRLSARQSAQSVSSSSDDKSSSEPSTDQCHAPDPKGSESVVEPATTAPDATDGAQKDEDEDDSDFNNEGEEDESDSDESDSDADEVKDDEDGEDDEDEDDDDDDDVDDDDEEDEDYEVGAYDEDGEAYDIGHGYARFGSSTADDPEPAVDSGSTACVAYVVPVNGTVNLYVANAGDSRAVLCRGGAAVDLSVDHKPEDDDEKERILAAGGTVTRDGRVNGGLNLSRAIGDHSYKVTKELPPSKQMITPLPDVSCFNLVPGADEFLVVACDGVWNSMTSQEVVNFVYDRLHPEDSNSTSDSTAHPSGDNVDDEALLKRIYEEILDHCLAPNTEGDGTGCDNMTCIIVLFKDLKALAAMPSTSPSKQPASADASVSLKRPVDLSPLAGDVDKCSSAENGVLSTAELNASKRPRTDDSSEKVVCTNGTSL